MRRRAVDGDGFAALDMARRIMVVNPDHSLVLLDPYHVIIACSCNGVISRFQP
jgi:hypothetical protein